VTAAADAGTLRLVVARDRDGRPWELLGRVEPLPGCAADVIQAYRLTLIARPTAGDKDVDVLRISPSTSYATWSEAVDALRLLADDVARGFSREGSGERR
jgi:hypothetical protein